jgi:uncharacterized iron-regulated membrane protein
MLPASFVVAAGLLLLHKESIDHALGLATLPPNVAPSATVTQPGEALEAALARFPGSTITMLAMPGKNEPWYRVRLKAPNESPRKFGATTVYVSAADGSILKVHDVATASPARAFMDGLYPFHTGRLGGAVGQALLVSTAILLIVLGTFGLRMWLARRASRTPRAK